MHPSRRSSAAYRYVGAVVLTSFLYVPAARAQVGRTELRPFTSTTLTDEEVLTGKLEGKAVVLAGELRIPRPGVDRLPAVVLVHGSGGLSGYIDAWVERLGAMGVATFVFDSYTPRELTSVTNDHALFGSLAMAVDAFRALAVVAKHPRIDPSRIGIMGFSFGGQTALATAMKRFSSVYGSAGSSYALYIAFYPLCITSYLHDDDVASRPIRIFHGAADDLAPASACRDYVQRLQKAGKDATLTEYAGAHHVFDWAALKDPTRLPQAQNMSACRIQERSEGFLVNIETGQRFNYGDRCVKRGATVGYNAAAHDRAIEAVTDLVTAVLKPK